MHRKRRERQPVGLLPNLKSEPQRKLSLPWIPDSDAEEAVEVKQCRRTKWIEVVGVIEGFKDLKARDKR